MTTKRRLTVTVATVALFLVVTAIPALAHVTVTPESEAADSYTVLTFGVPHGCDGSPTTKLSVSIPEGVVSVKPQMVPGWGASTTVGPYEEPVELHGETVSEGVKEVVWTAQGQPLPDELYQTFGLSVKLPDSEGETLAFPAIQTCEHGETAWIEPTPGGRRGTRAPRPFLTLTAAEGEGGDGDVQPTAGAALDSSDISDDQVQTSAPSDGETDWLSIIALVVGGLGLLAGGAALTAARRKTA